MSSECSRTTALYGIENLAMLPADPASTLFQERLYLTANEPATSSGGRFIRAWLVLPVRGW